MATPPPELLEKDFIQEGYRKNPFPFWLWVFLLTGIIALAWGGSSWYSSKVGTIFQDSPFLQVTNRDLSLFLWQNPEFMRINSKQKNGYLTDFYYVDRVTMDLAAADHYAAAPPDLLFRYHTWSRLIKNESPIGQITQPEFQKFLDDVPEWQPTYWPNAPKEYAQFVQNLSKNDTQDLKELKESILPLEVRIAFQGWKNYFIDGEAINQVKPTVSQMRQFLSTHPHFARNYWRNIVMDVTPNYLKGIQGSDDKAIVPADHMSSFLKVAIFNYLGINTGRPKEAEPKSDR